MQAKERRDSSTSWSPLQCLEGLFGGASCFQRLGQSLKNITRKRDSVSEPIDMGQMPTVYEDPTFSVEGCDKGKGRWSEEVCYEADSPDEAALVHAAKAYGFTLLERTPDHVTVQLPRGKRLTFEVLDVLTFDSMRRRMSIIVLHPHTNKIIMYTKGADSGIMERLLNPFEGRN